MENRNDIALQQKLDKQQKKALSLRKRIKIVRCAMQPMLDHYSSPPIEEFSDEEYDDESGVTHMLTKLKQEEMAEDKK